MAKLLLLLVFKVYLSIAAEPDAEWAYHSDYGAAPDQWDTIDARCGGDEQSPINIGGAVYHHFPPLVFTHHRENYVPFINNEHTVGVFSNMPTTNTLSGGPLGDAVYQLAQYHFHWSPSNSLGAEHTIHGESFPLEVHFVHYHNRYADLTEAAGSGDRDALAVIGIVFKISHANPTISHLQNDDHWPLWHKQETEIGVIDFSELLNSLPSRDFYTYDGSLTTPGCMEIVKWIVMKDSLTVSFTQLNRFRGLIAKEDGSPMTTNFRPVQALNGRIIRRNFLESDEHMGDGDDEGDEETETETESAVVPVPAPPPPPPVL